MSALIQDILKECESRLSGVDSPRLSAELLAAHALDCSRRSLVLDRDRRLTEPEVRAIETLVARREVGEPVAYILGGKEFYGLDFAVTQAVLIPRPETEHIVEEVERLYPKDQPLRFLDLGTGSGILAVTIAALFPAASGVAVDISQAALEIARSNAGVHGVEGRIEFQQLDFTREMVNGSFDLVVSNPPYVTRAEFEAASLEVTGFEPTGALVSGEDGLDHIRAMLPGVKSILKPGGCLLMEIGCGQGGAVQKIILDQFPEFGAVRVLKDLAGLDRVVCARRL